MFKIIKRAARKSFHFFLALQFLFSAQIVYANPQGHTYDTFAGNPITISSELASDLENSDLGSMFYFISDGNQYRAYYVGMYDITSGGKLCFTRSQTCLVGWEHQEKLDFKSITNSKGFEVIAPDSPDFVQQTQGNDLTSSKNAGSNSNGGNNSNKISDISNGSAKATNENFAGKIGSDVVSSAAQAAFVAGTTAVAVNFFAGASYLAAMENLNNAKSDYLDSAARYSQSVAAGARRADELVRRIKTIDNIAQVDLTHAHFDKGPVFNLKELNKQIVSFDSDYKSRIQNVANKILEVPFVNSVRQRDLKILGTVAIQASIESRISGWNDISNAQVSMAEEIADLLYGLDPITGVHRGLYEIFTGKNIITGRPLSNLERGLSGANAALGLSSFGILPGLGKAFKAVSMIARRGLPTALTAAKDTIAISKEFVAGISAAGMMSKTDIKIADQFLKKEIASGTLHSASEARVTLETALAKGEISKSGVDSGLLASNSATKQKLTKQLAVESQLAERGVVIAGGDSGVVFRNAEISAQRYGGDAVDYVKKSSTAYKMSDGQVISSHWIENTKTGLRYEQKTIIE